MTTLVTGDLHFSSNARDEYRHDFVDWLVDVVVRKRVKRVVILGDITEEKDRHNAYLVNSVVQHIVRLAGACDEVVIIRGNHDAIDPDCPFFGFVNHITNVRWINSPEEALWGKRRVIYLPNVVDYKTAWQQFDFSKYAFVFSHNTFDGASIGRGVTIEGTPLDMFYGARVISGDIHIPQKLGPVTYVGAPYLVDFGDDYEPRVLLIRGDKVSSMSTVKAGPQKRLIETTASGWVKDLRKAASGDILKVRVFLEPQEKAEWSEISSKIKRYCERMGFEAYMVQAVSRHGKATADSPTRNIKRVVSDRAAMKHHAEKFNVDERTLKVGLKIMRQA